MQPTGIFTSKSNKRKKNARFRKYHQKFIVPSNTIEKEYMFRNLALLLLMLTWHPSEAFASLKNEQFFLQLFNTTHTLITYVHINARMQTMLLN